MPTSRTLSMSVAVSIRWRLTPDSGTVMVNQPLSVALLRTKVALRGQLAARSCLASELMLKVLSRCAGARYADRRSTHCGINGGWRWDVARTHRYSCGQLWRIKPGVYRGQTDLLTWSVTIWPT